MPGEELYEMTPNAAPVTCRAKSGLVEKMKARAESRKLEDLTIGPVLSWTTDKLLGHVDALLKIPGACVCGLGPDGVMGA
jgi:hypothetical protein